MLQFEVKASQLPVEGAGLPFWIFPFLPYYCCYCNHKLSPSPSGHQVAPPDRAGPALPGPAGGAPATRRFGRRGFRSVCLPPIPSHGLPYEGESQAPVIRCGPLTRDASDFSLRTPGKATRGRLGRLCRISEITAQVRA